MPNHVTTRCVITGPADEVSRFKTLMIFEKLAERFPLLDFQCATFDEGWNFAAFGHFAEGTLHPFKNVTPDDAIYARVYGHAPEKDEDDEEAA